MLRVFFTTSYVAPWIFWGPRIYIALSFWAGVSQSTENGYMAVTIRLRRKFVKSAIPLDFLLEIFSFCAGADA